MFPLLEKDKLQIPYVACNVIFLCLAGIYAEETAAVRSASCVVSCNSLIQMLHSQKLKWLVIGLSCTGMLDYILVNKRITVVSIGMLVLHAMELLVPPPARYPDLYPALFSIYGCANLTFIYLVGVYWMYSCEHTNASRNKKML